METIYPYAFLGIVATSVFWLFFAERGVKASFLKGGFLLSLFIYVATMLLNDGSWIYKILWILPRDLSVIVLAVLALHRLLKHFKLFALGLLAFGVFNQLFYFNVLKSSFNFSEGLAENAEILFQTNEGADIASINKSIEEFEVTVKPAFSSIRKPELTLLDNTYTLDIPKENLYQKDDVIEALKESGLVVWVEENETITLSPEESETDTKVGNGLSSIGVNDPQIEKQWAFAAMNIGDFYKALENAKPKKKAKIAILDTGVDAGHEDLKGNYSSTESNSDQDGNGHGTHCAGIAAAVSNNGLGIASMAFGNDYVEVTSIQVLSSGGTGTQQDIIEGILKAADSGADVISMSLGGYSDDESQKAYAEAVEYANKAGAIVVVAAGNSDDDAKYYSPANVKGVIAVSAVDDQIRKASFSNTVDNIEMAVAAPGTNIFSTYPGNQYKALNGTSMATPYVAGLLGIMKSINPEASTQEIFKILNGTGIDTDDSDKTGKFIQPAKAVGAL